MKVFVTGTEGYIGNLLAGLLLSQGIEVVALDTGYYREGWLFHTPAPTPMTHIRDLRHVTPELLAGVDAVVHLAELSNDPTGMLAPHITHDINHKASVQLAGFAKAAGVKRFVYASSCSVYGLATEGFVTEESPVNPQTAYAQCKTLVERDVSAMAGPGFSPCYLRNATAYGTSPRMRFDIVVNNLCGLARTTGKIAMISDGSPWRPQVHVLDICKAILCCLKAPVEAIHDQKFNVGRTDENFTVRQIAEMVAEVFTGCELTFGPPSQDNRSYRVSFDKIATRLPGFACDWTVAEGVRQLHTLFKRIAMGPEIFEHRAFTRLKCLQNLLATGQIDANFFWTADGLKSPGA